MHEADLLLIPGYHSGIMNQQYYFLFFLLWRNRPVRG